MPALLEPVEELALVALAEALGDLSGVRPGGWAYPVTPTVRRVLPPTPQQLSDEDLWRLYVVPGQGSVLAGQARGKVQSGAPSVVYRHDLHVEIHGLVTAAEGVEADTWRWRLREDVFAVVHQAWSLGGVAKYGLDFTGQPAAVDEGELRPHALFMLPLTIGLRREYATA